MTFLSQWMDAGKAKESALAAARAKYPDCEVSFAILETTSSEGWRISVHLKHKKWMRFIWLSVKRYSFEVRDAMPPNGEDHFIDLTRKRPMQP